MNKNKSVKTGGNSNVSRIDEGAYNIDKRMVRAANARGNLDATATGGGFDYITRTLDEVKGYPILVLHGEDCGSPDRLSEKSGVTLYLGEDWNSPYIDFQFLEAAQALDFMSTYTGVEVSLEEEVLAAVEEKTEITTLKQAEALAQKAKFERQLGYAAENKRRDDVTRQLAQEVGEVGFKIKKNSGTLITFGTADYPDRYAGQPSEKGVRISVNTFGADAIAEGSPREAVRGLLRHIAEDRF